MVGWHWAADTTRVLMNSGSTVTVYLIMVHSCRCSNQPNGPFHHVRCVPPYLPVNVISCTATNLLINVKHVLYSCSFRSHFAVFTWLLGGYMKYCNCQFGCWGSFGWCRRATIVVGVTFMLLSLYNV
jgi:hypothetical protein